MLVIHHGPSAMEMADHLGFIVAIELTDGGQAIGRVDAVDERFVYLGRTERHPTVLLSHIKRVDRR